LVALGGEIAMLDALETAWQPNIAKAPAPHLRMIAQADDVEPCVKAGRADRTMGAICRRPARVRDRDCVSLRFIARSLVCRCYC